MRWGTLLAAFLLASPALAAEPLEARARAGDADAAYRLAISLERSKRDYARAMRLHCEAAARGHPGAAFRAFDFVNRNKRAIALDLSTEAGSAVVRKLAETADVFAHCCSIVFFERACQMCRMHSDDGCDFHQAK